MIPLLYCAALSGIMIADVPPTPAHIEAAKMTLPPPRVRYNPDSGRWTAATNEDQDILIAAYAAGRAFVRGVSMGNTEEGGVYMGGPTLHDIEPDFDE